MSPYHGYSGKRNITVQESLRRKDEIMTHTLEPTERPAAKFAALSHNPVSQEPLVYLQSTDCGYLTLEQFRELETEIAVIEEQLRQNEGELAEAAMVRIATQLIDNEQVPVFDSEQLIEMGYSDVSDPSERYAMPMLRTIARMHLDGYALAFAPEGNQVRLWARKG